MGKKGKAKGKGLTDSVGLEKALTMSLDDLHATLQGDIDMSPVDEDQIVQQLQAGVSRVRGGGSNKRLRDDQLSHSQLKKRQLRLLRKRALALGNEAYIGIGEMRHLTKG